MQKFYFLNDEIVEASKAKFHVSDLSILRGYGIFDFLRTSDGKPLFIDDHIHRFNQSASLFHFDHGYQDNFIKSQILKLLALNGFPESGIKLVMTGGYSENGFDPGKPNLAILVDQLYLPPEQFYRDGVKLITHQYVREFPEVKSTNYLTAILTARKCKEENALDVLYHDGDIVSEVTRSNIFMMKNHQIITPKSGILKGITRSKVIQLAGDHYEVVKRDVKLIEIYQADEVFMTSSMKRIMPVVDIDGKLIGNGVPGEITLHISSLFRAFEKASVLTT